MGTIQSLNLGPLLGLRLLHKADERVYLERQLAIVVDLRACVVICVRESLGLVVDGAPANPIHEHLDVVFEVLLGSRSVHGHLPLRACLCFLW